MYLLIYAFPDRYLVAGIPLENHTCGVARFSTLKLVKRSIIERDLAALKAPINMMAMNALKPVAVEFDGDEEELDAWFIDKKFVHVCGSIEVSGIFIDPEFMQGKLVYPIYEDVIKELAGNLVDGLFAKSRRQEQFEEILGKDFIEEVLKPTRKERITNWFKKHFKF